MRRFGPAVVAACWLVGAACWGFAAVRHATISTTSIYAFMAITGTQIAILSYVALTLDSRPVGSPDEGQQP